MIISLNEQSNSKPFAASSAYHRANVFDQSTFELAQDLTVEQNVFVLWTVQLTDLACTVHYLFLLKHSMRSARWVWPKIFSNSAGIEPGVAPMSVPLKRALDH